MNFITLVSYDIKYEEFDLIAIVELDITNLKPKKDKYHKDAIYTYHYNSPQDFNKTVYFQAYDDALEVSDELNFIKDMIYSTFADAQKGLIREILSRI